VEQLVQMVSLHLWAALGQLGQLGKDLLVLLVYQEIKEQLDLLGLLDKEQ
jgi:hypothetical protein